MKSIHHGCAAKRIVQLVFFAIAVNSTEASASWGAWGEEAAIRGDGHSKWLQHAVVERQNAIEAAVGSSIQDAASTAKYESTSFFGADDDYYQVKSISKLTRSPIDKHLVRYVMQPLLASVKNGAMGDIAFAFNEGSKNIIVDRDPASEMLSGGNAPKFMLVSSNTAVRSSEKPVAIKLLDTVGWEQAIELNLSKVGGRSVKSSPTQFAVTRLSNDNVLIEYSVKSIKYSIRDGEADLSSNGFTVLDKGFNVTYVSGLSYHGSITRTDGTITPVKGRRLSRAQEVGFDADIVAGLPQRMMAIENDFHQKSELSELKPLSSIEKLNDIYAAVDPIMSMWEMDSQAVGEHRSNINPVLDVVSAADMAITMAVNAVGAAIGNKAYQDWNGPVYAATDMGVSLAMMAAGKNADAIVANGQTAGQLAASNVGLAVSLMGIGGDVKIITSVVDGGVALINSGGALGRVISGRGVKQLVLDTVSAGNLYSDSKTLKDAPQSIANTASLAQSTYTQSASPKSGGYLPVLASAGTVGGLGPINAVSPFANTAIQSPVSGLGVSSSQNTPNIPNTPNVPIISIVLNPMVNADNIVLAETASTTLSNGNIVPLGMSLTNGILNLGVHNLDFSFQTQSISSASIKGLPAAMSQPLGYAGGINPIAIATNGTGATIGSTTYAGLSNSNTLYTVIEYAGASVPATAVSSSGLQYSEFGFAWQMTSAANEYLIPFAYGSALTASMPQTGSANYTGSLVGYDIGTRVTGAINMNVNFQSASLTGNLSYASGLSVNGAGIALFYGSANIAGVVNGNGFSGTSSGVGYTGFSPNGVGAVTSATSGIVQGHFYGSNANEITGVVSLVGVNEHTVLAFGAHK